MLPHLLIYEQVENAVGIAKSMWKDVERCGKIWSLAMI
jgi:hypothetical protein